MWNRGDIRAGYEKSEVLAITVRRKQSGDADHVNGPFYPVPHRGVSLGEVRGSKPEPIRLLAEGGTLLTQKLRRKIALGSTTPTLVAHLLDNHIVGDDNKPITGLKFK